jgi:hypothetical protein
VSHLLFCRLLEKWRKRVGVELFLVLQGKDFRLESIASPDEYLNFRTPIAHELAHWGGFWVPHTHLAHGVQIRGEARILATPISRCFRFAKVGG